MIRRTPLRKISEKGKKKAQEKRKTVELDKAFYSEIWDEREHVCYETGKYLGEEPLMTMFHHILPKSKYPQYRHCKWNIVILHPDIHNQVETFIDKCPRVKELTEKLKYYDNKEGIPETIRNPEEI